MDCQDWEVVTVRKKKTGGSGSGSGSGAGGRGGPGNRNTNSESAQIRKFSENDIVTVKKLSKESVQEIVSRRALMNMSQVQLNQACLFPVNTINKIESGQYSPTIGQLNKLNQVLKTGLKYS